MAVGLVASAIAMQLSEQRGILLRSLVRLLYRADVLVGIERQAFAVPRYRQPFLHSPVPRSSNGLRCTSRHVHRHFPRLKRQTLTTDMPLQGRPRPTSPKLSLASSFCLAVIQGFLNVVNDVLRLDDLDRCILAPAAHPVQPASY